MTESLNGKKARVLRRHRNVCGEEVRPGDVVYISMHKKRAATVTISRPKVGISGIPINDLEVIPDNQGDEYG